VPTFKYRARNSEGGIVEDLTEATNKFDLVRSMKDHGLTVVFAKEVAASSWWNMGSFNRFITRVKLREKIVFTRNLASMITAGVSLSRALEILEKQTKNIKLKDVIHSLLSDIEVGDSLSDAMKKFPNIFSSLYVSMVHSGEESGKLVESFGVIAKQLERNYSLRKKIKSAMMYPSIVLIAMVIIAIILFIYVVPSLTATFKEFNVELPLSTKMIMAISDFLAANTVLAISLIIGTVVLVAMLLKTPKGKRFSDFFVLHIPVISEIVKEYNAAQTMRTLSSLFSSGVAVVDSLNITEDVLQNSYYKAVLKKASDVVQKGTPLSGIFLENENIYPILVGEMMQVGEETGKLADMLERIANFYEDEIDTVTKDISTIIEPILMLFIAGGVGFFAVAMIAPMYTLTASI